MNMKGTQFLEHDIHVDAFSGPGRILWVMSTAALANNFWRHVLNCSPSIRMGYPGMAFVGEGFDRIMLDDIYLQCTGLPKGREEILRASIDMWIHEGLRPRLTEGGVLEMLVEVGSS